MCGVVGVGFIKLLGWAKTAKPKGWQVAGLPVLSLTALGAAAMRYPEMLGNGKDVVQQALANPGGDEPAACAAGVAAAGDGGDRAQRGAGRAVYADDEPGSGGRESAGTALGGGWPGVETDSFLRAR